MPALNAAIADTGYSPAVIFSALGYLRDAHLRVPIDAVVDAEILNPDADPFGVSFVGDWDFFNDGRPVAAPSDLPDFEKIGNIDLSPKPHWNRDEVHSEPLTLLYAHGGMSKPDSTPNYHVIISGNKERPGGRAETYVGQVRPGTVVHRGVWLAVGLESAQYRGSNVDVLTVSIDVGEDIVHTLQRFLDSPRAKDINRCFIFSATGQVRSAKFCVPFGEGDAEKDDANISYQSESVDEPQALLRLESSGVYVLEAQPGGTPYEIESMTAIFGGDQETPQLHAALVMPVVEGELKYLSRRGESVGGVLIEAIVGGDMPVDLCIGETHETLRDFEF